MFKKIGEAIKQGWDYVQGKKRRIANIGGFLMIVFPANTVAFQIGAGLTALFGVADLAQLTKKKVGNKLPGGLADED